MSSPSQSHTRQQLGHSCVRRTEPPRHQAYSGHSAFPRFDFFVDLEEDAADDFRDLRDDGVAEGGQGSVNQSRGKPISQATHVGFSCPPAAADSRIVTTVSRFGNRVCAFSTASGVISAAIAEHVRGVGHRRR